MKTEKVTPDERPRYLCFVEGCPGNHPSKWDVCVTVERYEQAIRNRDAGKATLSDAVAIARGRPGPPSVPVQFDGEPHDD